MKLLFSYEIYGNGARSWPKQPTPGASKNRQKFTLASFDWYERTYIYEDKSNYSQALEKL